MHFTKRQSTAALRFVSAVCLTAVSQAAASADLVLPNAGSLLRDVKPKPAAPAASSPSPLRVSPAPVAAAPASAPLTVQRLVIKGNTVFETATLHALIAPMEGQRLTLTQIDANIGAITEYYRRAGYPLARAIIPVQTIDAGVVTVQVIEGQLGAVVLDNGSNMSTVLLRKSLSDLQPGAVIRQDALDDALLLLTDLPGIVATSVLRPGQAVGSSDLAITVQPGAAAGGDVTVDNYGSRYTGRDRVGANLLLFNPLRGGDVLGLSALASGSSMAYGRLSYEVPLDGKGTYWGAAASTLHYSLIGSAANLQAHGTAQTGSIWLRKYLTHHPSSGTSVRLQYEPSKLRDDVDTAGTHNSRHFSLWSVELQARADDAWFGGGYSSATVGVRSGNLVFDDSATETSDAKTAKTKGSFGVGSLSVQRFQRLGRLTNLMLAFNGQWAQSNLDASQKFSLGGARSVRAYEGGVLSGDSGQFASLELQQTLPPAWTGSSRWRAVAFMDAGQVQINHTPWSTGSNQAYISGAGLGINWQGPANWRASAYAAQAMAPAPSQLNGTESTHSSAWLEVAKKF